MKQHKTNQYILAAIIAVSIIILNQAFIQYWLYQKSEDAKNINIAGRQRMLSQMINLEFERINRNRCDFLYLKKSFEEWKTVHQALQFGHDSLNIKAIQHETVLQKLENLNVHIAYIEQVIADTENNYQIRLEDIYQNQADFLSQMNAIVKILEEDSDSKLDFIICTDIILALISVIVIMIEAGFIYLPIYKKLTFAIKKLKNSERNLKAIQEASIASLTFISPDFNILYTNQQAKKTFKRLFGREAKVGDSILKFYELDTQEDFTGYFDRALKGENIQIERFVDGNWWLLIFYPVYDEEKVIGIVKIRQDITDIKVKDTVIEERTEKLKQIAWNQSHLIRSPLANILGLTDLLGDDTLPEKEKLMLVDLLRREAKRLDDVIYHIVDLADTEAPATVLDEKK